MPCAAGELCLWLDGTPKEPDGHTCRGGCDGRLHGNCGDVDQESDTEMQRICPTCDEEVEKNVSDDEKRRAKIIRGDARCHRLIMQNFRPTSVPWKASRRSVACKEAAQHLQKTKMVMIHAHASRPARQTDIIAFAVVTERNDGERGGSGSVS